MWRDSKLLHSEKKSQLPTVWLNFSKCWMAKHIFLGVGVGLHMNNCASYVLPIHIFIVIEIIHPTAIGKSISEKMQLCYQQQWTDVL
jgi:hypothetical protein